MGYKLFVFEGPDGSGKSHAVKEMHERLTKDGIKSYIVRLPSPDGIFYDVIRTILKDSNNIDTLLSSSDLKKDMVKYGKDLDEFKDKKECLLQTLMMLNMQDVVNDDKFSKLDNGSVLLLDRSFISTIVYGIKNKNSMFMEYKTFNKPIYLHYNDVIVDKLYYFDIGLDVLLGHASRRQKTKQCEENDKTESVIETNNIYKNIINMISDQTRIMRVCEGLIYEGNEVVLYNSIYEKIYSDILEICEKTDE